MDWLEKLLQFIQHSSRNIGGFPGQAKELGDIAGQNMGDMAYRAVNEGPGNIMDAYEGADVAGNMPLQGYWEEDNPEILAARERWKRTANPFARAASVEEYSYPTGGLEPEPNVYMGKKGLQLPSEQEQALWPGWAGQPSPPPFPGDVGPERQSSRAAAAYGGTHGRGGMSVDWSGIAPGHDMPVDSWGLGSFEKKDIAARAAIETREAEEAEVKASKEKMEAAAAQEKWIKESAAGPGVEGLSDPDKNILMDLGDYPSTAIRKIRAQAAAAGRDREHNLAGDIGDETGLSPEWAQYSDKLEGAGTFSQQTMSPELQARLDERDEWLSGQSFRDIRHELTRRGGIGEKYPSRAAYGLSQLAEQERANKKQQTADAILDQLAGTSGKIPHDQAMMYAQQGIPVPPGRVGKGRDEVLNQINELIKSAGEAIDMSRNPQYAGDPNVIAEGQAAQQYGPELVTLRNSLLAQGADPEEIYQIIVQKLNEIQSLKFAAPETGGIKIESGQ